LYRQCSDGNASDSSDTQRTVHDAMLAAGVFDAPTPLKLSNCFEPLNRRTLSALQTFESSRIVRVVPHTNADADSSDEPESVNSITNV
jgi:hypothetical protein